MSTLQMFPEHDSGHDDTPLPLLVAKKWGFPLAFHIVEGKHYYAIQDWVRGLLGEEDIRKIWSKFKTQKTWEGMSTSSRRMPYRNLDGRTYQRDFTLDEGLYLIAQYLRVTSSRPVLQEIRQFLAKAGVFIDELRRDENAIVITSGMTGKQTEAAAKRARRSAEDAYRREGKSEQWIQSRQHSRKKRNEFTTALSQAVIEMLTPRDYATFTDDIYTGLWLRTAAILRQEMNLRKGANLRDHQPRLALHFQGIVEEITAYELGERQEVTKDEARRIVQKVAAMIRPWVEQAQAHMKIDIATGLPLLPQG